MAGRRPKYDETASVYLHVRVTPGQRLELRRVAVENHTDVSDVIREAVEEYVADYDERRVFGRGRESRW